MLAALPAWAGAPDAAPAALAARYSASQLRTDGLAATTGADAGVQPAVAGRRAGPVVARPVATAARRHGRGRGLRGAEPCRAGPAGRAAGRGRRGRRSHPPAAGRCRLGRRRAARGAADGDARSDRRGPRRAGGGVSGRARRGARASRRWWCATAAWPSPRRCGAPPVRWTPAPAACCASACWAAAASRSCCAIGSGSCTVNGVRTGSGVSPRRTTVSANAARASCSSASMVSCGPLMTQRIIQR